MHLTQYSASKNVVHKWKSKMNTKIYVQGYYSLQQYYKQQNMGSNQILTISIYLN